MTRGLPGAAIALLMASVCCSAPRPDATYHPVVPAPAYATGTGPLVCFDEAHHNFHRLDGLFGAFGELVRADGFRLEASRERLAHGPPATCRVMVIANAQPDDRDMSEQPYPTPPAFDGTEIRALHDWVRHGGRLLLIADHMPFAGAAAPLAAAFGCRFLDGFAVANFTSEDEARAAFLRPSLLTAAAGTVHPHAVTRGRSQADAVTQVATFSGQAFRCGPEAQPLLTLPLDYVSLMPEKAWQFTMETPRVPVGGWMQGAALDFGSGRVAVFGEAGMFSAQITDDGRPMGFNAPGAEQNARYVLNLLEWLAAP